MWKFILLTVLGIYLQYTHADIGETLQNLNIPGIEGINNITDKLPSLEELEDKFLKNCEKVGGPTAGKNLPEAKQKVIECMKNLIDFNQLQEEMEIAKPTGDLDSVFKKHCKKTPDFKACISDFLTELQPCLKEKEKNSVNVIVNVTEQLAEFICFKEGDRIALFIAEGGPECLNSSKEEVWNCSETVFKRNFTGIDDLTLNDIPLFLFEAQQCQDFEEFQSCVVKKLEKCKEPTPANIIDSLFTFAKKATPCASLNYTRKSAEAQEGTGSSAFHFNISPALFVTTLSFLLLRLMGSD